MLFNSPHSGSIYPREFLRPSRLDIATLRRSEDSFVDELVAGVVRRGYPLMRAHFPRCFVDVNREPYELDPRMFEGRLPSFANTRSMRVAGGLGTVARVVGDAQEIYDQRIPVDDALARIESLYKPYHRALRRLFTRLHRDFGAAVLIDCHSMPSTAGHRDERPRPEFVLGDRYGTSCVGVVAETVEKTLRALGYTVSRNKPYAGGFITEHYGNPAAGLHAIQLEINRALYMDERRYRAVGGFRPAGGRSGDPGAAARRNSAGGAAPLPRRRRIDAVRTKTKKRAARGCKRPKSREETPKEGSGSSRYRIAIIYTATHKNQGQEPISMQFCMAESQLSSGIHRVRMPQNSHGWNSARQPKCLESAASARPKRRIRAVSVADQAGSPIGR